MKVVIFAGGLGTRLAEETSLRPKPMVEVGGRPILSHILQVYAGQGFNDFVVAAGYKHEVIEQYFAERDLLDGDLRFDFAAASFKPGRRLNVHVVDTGEQTQTGGRLRRLESVLRPHGTFMATYGDGLADVDLNELLAFHRSHGRIATLTAVHPPTPYGQLSFDGYIVTDTRAPSPHWVNGGFFVFEPAIFDYLSSDEDVLETAALSLLAREGQMMAYQHGGFWQCMDTVPERDLLENLWRSGRAPWRQRVAVGATATI
jgi:glucose-1-phosphate cytidylyltransferase